jgi:outer membrane protein insertion porin family
MIVHTAPAISPVSDGGPRSMLDGSGIGGHLPAVLSVWKKAKARSGVAQLAPAFAVAVAVAVAIGVVWPAAVAEAQAARAGAPSYDNNLGDEPTPDWTNDRRTPRTLDGLPDFDRVDLREGPAAAPRPTDRQTGQSQAARRAARLRAARAQEIDASFPEWARGNALDELEQRHLEHLPIIGGIEIRGDAEEAGASLRLLDLHPGMTWTPAAMQAALRKLYGRGSFASVTVETTPWIEPLDADALALAGPGADRRLTIGVIFNVVPVRTLLTVEVRGNDLLNDRDVTQEAGLLPGETFVTRRREAAARRLRETYARLGYRAAQIDFEIEPVGDRFARLTIIVNEGAPTLIDQITFEGRLGSPEALLRAETSVRSGDRLNLNRLDDDLRTLAAYYRHLGYYEARVPPEPDVRPAASGTPDRADVVLHVESGPRIEFRFDDGGGRAVPASSLMRMAGLDTWADFSPAGAAAFAARMQDRLRDMGYPRARVWGKVDSAERDALRRIVSFKIREGVKARIVSLEFAGNSVIDSPMLTDRYEQFLIGLLEDEGLFREGLLYPVGGEAQRQPDAKVYPRAAEERRVSEAAALGLYRPGPFRAAAEKLQQQYQRWGFLEAKVTGPVARYEDRSRVVRLRFDVTEGTRTFVRGLGFPGLRANLPDIDPALEAVPLGAPYDSVAIEQLRTELGRQLVEEGYLFARVDEETTFNADGSAAYVKMRVEEGPQVRVREVRFRGLLNTQPRVVRESLLFREGDIYRPQLAEATRRVLIQLGVFLSASVVVVDPTDEEELKDVVIEVRERPLNVIEPGFGLSTADGVRGFVEYRRLNLDGLAMEAYIRVRANYQVYDILTNTAFRDRLFGLPWFQAVERRVEAGWEYPRIFGWSKPYRVPHNVGARVTLLHERENGRAFGLDRTSITPSIDLEVIRRLSLLFQYEIEYSNLQVANAPLLLPGDGNTRGLTPGELQTLQLPQGAALIGTFRTTLTWDQRDNPFNPRSGYIISLANDFAWDLAGEFSARYMKPSFKVSGYIPLPLGKRWVIALSASAGNIFTLQGGDTPEEERAATPLNRRFYLGGRSTLRGFAENAVNPTFAQTALSTLNGVRADAFQLFSQGGNLFLLAKAEIRFPLYGALGGAVFFDTGGLWLRMGDFDINDLRYTTGFGIRYNTPVGPLAVDIGFNLTRKGVFGENPFALHFALGVF